MKEEKEPSVFWKVFHLINLSKVWLSGLLLSIMLFRLYFKKIDYYHEFLHLVNSFGDNVILIMSHEEFEKLSKDFKDNKED